MPIYEYKCSDCGKRFEKRQSITEAAMTVCPDCSGTVHRLISGGSGFSLNRGGTHQRRQHGDQCSFERSGTTCCGRQTRCEQPQCGGSE